jgi:hypothetical protein
MKIGLGHTMWEECALCGEGFRAQEVEAHTTLPGGYCARPVGKRCELGSKQWLKQRLTPMTPRANDKRGKRARVTQRGLLP